MKQVSQFQLQRELRGLDKDHGQKVSGLDQNHDKGKFRNRRQDHDHKRLDYNHDKGKFLNQRLDPDHGQGKFRGANPNHR